MPLPPVPVVLETTSVHPRTVARNGSLVVAIHAAVIFITSVYSSRTSPGAVHAGYGDLTSMHSIPWVAALAIVQGWGEASLETVAWSVTVPFESGSSITVFSDRS